MLYFRPSFIDFTKTKVIVYFLKQNKKSAFCIQNKHLYYIKYINLYSIFMVSALYLLCTIFFDTKHVLLSFFDIFILFHKKN